jgi:hypothetical protein
MCGEHGFVSAERVVNCGENGSEVGEKRCSMSHPKKYSFSSLKKMKKKNVLKDEKSIVLPPKK